MPARVGLLLITLGTPDAPRAPEVRRYLREFLSDPRVLDIPRWKRFLLLELLILPRRSHASAEAYRKIWGEAGSPLLVHGQALARGVQTRLGDAVHVELATRYGEPSIAGALDRLAALNVSRLAVLPLYPQYSGAATGSSVARVFELAAAKWNTPYLQVIPPFHDHPSYMEARVESVRPFLAAGMPERVFFSFHGVPERQIRRGDPSGALCLARPDCCAALGDANRYCYRAQCHASARALASRLAIPEDRWVICFQSRLGRTPWLRPYTDHVLAEEARRGVKRAVILSPGFVLDCLETLEELGIRGVETWRENGGEELAVVPALNSAPRFVESLATIAADGSSWIRAAVGREGR